MNLKMRAGVVALGILVVGSILWTVGGHYLVYPFSWVEFRMGSPIKAKDPEETVPCSPRVAAHRGNWQKGRFPQNSKLAIQAAADQGIRNIEVDLTVLQDEIILNHDDLDLGKPAALADLQGAAELFLPLSDFLDRYDSYFDRVVFDIKFVLSGQSNGLKLFEELDLKPEKHRLIGLNCRFLKSLQDMTGVPSGCEMHGVMSNYMLGFKLWSVSHEQVNSMQLALNRWLKLESILWTFQTSQESQRFCVAKPDLVLVSEP